MTTFASVMLGLFALNRLVAVNKIKGPWDAVGTFCVAACCVAAILGLWF